MIPFLKKKSEIIEVGYDFCKTDNGLQLADPRSQRKGLGHLSPTGK